MSALDCVFTFDECKELIVKLCRNGKKNSEITSLLISDNTTVKVDRKMVELFLQELIREKRLKQNQEAYDPLNPHMSFLSKTSFDGSHL